MDTHKYLYDNLDDHKGIESKILEYTSYIKNNKVNPNGELSDLTYDNYEMFIIATELAMDNYLKYTMNGDDMYLEIGFSHGESGVAEAKKAFAIFESHGY